MHPVIIKSLAASSSDYYRFTYAEVFNQSLGYISLAYLASLVLWCLVERPMASLTNLMVPKRRSRESKPTQEPLSPNAVSEEGLGNCRVTGEAQQPA
mmetsp:Transcript_39419/g.118037  ORF Transcript_39419/g.118037 Transcript_39419/m.118037 type:complete len:97 (-) Transcript_39419:121-411(-)